MKANLMKIRFLIGILVIFLGIQLWGSCAEEVPSKGEQLYMAYCANCHGKQGEGLAALIPPLAKADYLIQHAEELPCMIRYGMSGPITVNGKEYNQPMLPLKQMTVEEIYEVSNYVLNSWGNEYRKLYQQEIELYLKRCAEKSSDK